MKEQEQNQKLNNKDHSLGDKIISGAKKVWKRRKMATGDCCRAIHQFQAAA